MSLINKKVLNKNNGKIGKIAQEYSSGTIVIHWEGLKKGKAGVFHKNQLKNIDSKEQGIDFEVE